MHAFSATWALIRRRWPIIIMVWMLPALLAALETWTFWRMFGRPHPFWRAVIMQAPAWLMYAALTPPVLLLGTALPIARSRLARNLLVHITVALVAGAAYAVIATAASKAFSPLPNPRPFAQMALMWYLSALPLTMLAYACILGAGAAVTHFTDAKRREVDAVRLTAQLSDARLSALRMQLHPHFLFNTLNAIMVLARDRDHEAVVRMLALLSDLLRDVLRSDGGHEVTLSAEVSFVRRYLAIEMVRFGDRLIVHDDVDPALGEAIVPAFILQPLVENALRHGMASSTGKGTIVIGARALGTGSVTLFVDDFRARNGDTVRTVAMIGPELYGVGLSNTAARLEALFGAAAELCVRTDAEGRTRASITLPLRHERTPATFSVSP